MSVLYGESPCLLMPSVLLLTASVNSVKKSYHRHQHDYFLCDSDSGVRKFWTPDSDARIYCHCVTYWLRDAVSVYIVEGAQGVQYKTCNKVVSRHDTLEVTRPTRIVHQPKPHRLNVQSRSSARPESESPPKDPISGQNPDSCGLWLGFHTRGHQCKKLINRIGPN